jgi:lysophospholipase L1-like esterase
MDRIGKSGQAVVRRFRRVSKRGPACLAAFVCTIICCVPGSNDTQTGTGAGSQRVFILGSEHLELPAVGREKVFKPEVFWDIDPDSPDAGQATGFFMTVATGDAAGLKARITNSKSGKLCDLQRVSPPGTAEGRALAEQPGVFNETVAELLKAGTGVFWRVDEPSAGDGLEHRYGFLVPQPQLSPFTRLIMFNRSGQDGTPLGADSIGLVGEFFYMASIGDSVMWGNGLSEQRKFRNLVADAIEAETAVKVISQVYAHSGAEIVPKEGDGICTLGCSGEVPTVETSITVQADLIERPELMDLILVDGCINDVGISTIFFEETPEDELIDMTEHFCHDEMTSLLEKVRGLAPQAHIVVTAYFPVVSVDSNLLGLRQWALARGERVGDDLIDFKAQLVANSNVFYGTSLQSLRTAVETVNAASEDAGMVLMAPVDFGPSNAMFAADSWLWGLTDESLLGAGVSLGLSLFPEDQMLEFREAACPELEDPTLGELVFCLYASLAHPNVAGAQAYADAIIEKLREAGFMPPE